MSGLGVGCWKSNASVTFEPLLLIKPHVTDCSVLWLSQTWEENHLFADEKQATLFLGALDSIFLFSYAVVSG